MTKIIQKENITPSWKSKGWDSLRLLADGASEWRAKEIPSRSALNGTLDICNCCCCCRLCCRGSFCRESIMPCSSNGGFDRQTTTPPPDYTGSLNNNPSSRLNSRSSNERESPFLRHLLVASFRSNRNFCHLSKVRIALFSELWFSAEYS